jgi:hypothetical protein
MKKFAVVLVIAALALSVSTAGAASTLTTLYYGDIVLDGTTHVLPGSWNLNDGPLTISYEIDLSGAPNVAYDWDWGKMGIVGLRSSDWMSGAQMVGFLSDWGLPQFPTYPDNNASLDTDDKFNLQRFPNPGSWDETMYDVYCAGNTVAATPFGTYLNYGIWFDRDGVDQWQDDMWGMVNGGTYNTLGVYTVELLFRKASDTAGTVCPKFFPNLLNPLNQSTSADDIYGIPTGFYSGAWTPNGPDLFPAGLSFQANVARLGDMRALVEGSPAPGTIILRDVTVTGYLNLEEGTATGGGWFIPEDDSFIGTTPGGKATFGFVARNKNAAASGNLEFQYHADGLELRSTSFDWVNVANTQAIFEGVGLLNGTDEVRFRVQVVDGDKLGTGIDRFVIRIFDTDPLTPTYHAEGNLGGGQIVVHKK